MKIKFQSSTNITPVLSGQAITMAGPGSILRDVATILAFIGKAGLVTGSKLGNLASQPLASLNALLASPINIPLKRPLLTSYPNISGIYILLRVMALVQVEGKRIRLAQDTLSVWQGLNHTEQYFALMEAWLWHASAEVVGEDDPHDFNRLFCVTHFLSRLDTREWTTFDEFTHRIHGPNSISQWSAMLMQQFGLVELEPLPLEKRTYQGGGQGWMLGKARLTAWGEALTHVLVEKFPTDYMDNNPETPVFGDLVAAFSPFIAELKNAFHATLPATQVGTYIFKVSFTHGAPGVSCLLSVPGDAYLDKLAFAVLRAFSFEDTEHMFDFTYRDYLGKPVEVRCTNSDEGPWADEIAVAATRLPLNGSMRFLFDYGDSWKFDLQLLRIDPPGAKNAPIQLIELTGTPPEQYGNW